MQRGIEAVGGRLTLTAAELHFEAHRFNAQRGPTTIPLTDLQEVSPTWAKVFGFLPLAPNSIRVSTKSGATFSFVVTKREAWIEAITQACLALEGASPESQRFAPKSF